MVFRSLLSTFTTLLQTKFKSKAIQQPYNKALAFQILSPAIRRIEKFRQLLGTDCERPLSRLCNTSILTIHSIFYMHSSNITIDWARENKKPFIAVLLAMKNSRFTHAHPLPRPTIFHFVLTVLHPVREGCTGKARHGRNRAIKVSGGRDGGVRVWNFNRKENLCTTW